MAKKKGNNTASRVKTPKPVGDMVKLLNMSDTDKFCAWTGLKLPRNGMAVEHDGKYFINRDAVKQYVRANEPLDAA